MAAGVTGPPGNARSTPRQAVRAAPRRAGRSRSLERTWPASPAVIAALTQPRDGVVLERAAGADRFVQGAGPFVHYERTLRHSDDGRSVREVVSYRLAIPWFGWLAQVPVRHLLGRDGARSPTSHGTRPGLATTAVRSPWWAPPERLSAREVSILGLLAAASMASAFLNTLFTQTVNFAAADFGVGEGGVGVAGSVVRAGIIVVLPVAALADRAGRRRVVSGLAVAAPVVAAAGAIAPNFPLLVATQTVGRPLGLALDFMIGVVAAEEVPRSSRAYALSVLALASGVGAGVAVAALPLADLSPSGWRGVYVVALVWLVVAVDIARRLPETRRFERPHVTAPRLDRRRFAVLGGIGLLTNLFIAPATFFQNGYLRDERGYSAAAIAVFTLATATPAAVGLVLGGRIAEAWGRRRTIALALPAGAALLVLSYSVAGAAMWAAVVLAGVIAGAGYPALAVYRGELFPTGNRGRAAGLLTAASLVGGIVGLLAMGQLLERGHSHGVVMAALAGGQLGAVAIALRWLPETAHRELEELNPLDAAPPTEPFPAGS